MSIPKSIGRYEIVDELGRGAMGSVFRARDPAMDRFVAVKTILSGALASEQGAEFRMRFYREAKAAGALAHPGIVPVFDVGEDNGTPFLVMEFVEGQTLGNAMKKGERASLDRVCEIGQKIAEALGYAHRNGVIHRDIKPANILLTSREIYGDERPKITDFGVAKLGAGELTITGQFLGTPAFMPPEQFTGSPIDGRTDLFSLGVILYWMATGEQPFSGETMTAVSYKVVHTEPIPPAKLNPAIPAQLEAVILKCLAKNPANRYQTGEELAQALAELRTNVRGPGLHTLVPAPIITGGESKDTLDAPPSMRSKADLASTETTGVQLPQPIPQAKPPKKRAVLAAFVAAGMVAVAAAAGGGYMLWHRHRHAPEQPIPPQSTTSAPVTATDWAVAGADSKPVPGTEPASQQATPAQDSAPTAAQGTSPATEQKPAAGVAGALAPPSNAAPSSAQAAASAPRPQPPPVAFNPKKLDPKKNTRLKFDLGHFPASLAFTVEMDGKTFFRGHAASKADYDGLYVPPGVHEFRIEARAGAVQKASNIVSANFIAKKHMTLKVELRPLPNGTAAAAVSLDPAAQIVASLKTDLFSF